MSNTNDEQTKRTAHDVQLPAVARANGFQPTWYYKRDGEIVAVRGDQETTGAFWMLAHDVADDHTRVEESVSASELPTDFAPVATDGGARDD